MDYRQIDTGILKLAAILFFAASFISISQEGYAQERSYEIVPAPDIWYNSVDGVRAGVRVRGRVPGSYDDGPHRLDFGIWLGTKLPEDPVTYYISFTEPIPAISDFGSEGNVRLRSSVRTGFQRHGVSLNKRWQPGFNELNYRELTIGLRADKRYDNDYLLYPQLWQSERLFIAHTNFDWHDENGVGRYRFYISADANIAGSYENFVRSQVQYHQHIPLSDLFEISGRVYASLAGDNTAPEYLFMQSMAPAISWMDRGLTRARGTIPPAMFRSGAIHISEEGPNLRGYVYQESSALNSVFPGAPVSAPLYKAAASVNIELDYPNPLDQAIRKVPVLGEFMDLRSYLFYDGGTFRQAETAGSTSAGKFISDAGLGFQFSFNIPDYLGKERGLLIRYDLPLWLSHPGDEKAFKFRNILGVGAVIAI